MALPHKMKRHLRTPQSYSRLDILLASNHEGTPASYRHAILFGGETRPPHDTSHRQKDSRRSTPRPSDVHLPFYLNPTLIPDLTLGCDNAAIAMLRAILTVTCRSKVKPVVQRTPSFATGKPKSNPAEGSLALSRALRDGNSLKRFLNADGGQRERGYCINGRSILLCALSRPFLLSRI